MPSQAARDLTETIMKHEEITTEQIMATVHEFNDGLMTAAQMGALLTAVLIHRLVNLDYIKP